MDKVRCTRLTNIEDTPKNASEIARDGPPENRESLLKIASAWRECADNAENKIKDTSSSVDGD